MSKLHSAILSVSCESGFTDKMMKTAFKQGHIAALEQAGEVVKANELEQQSILADLQAVAEHRLRHVNNGLCPDELEGFNSRDLTCPACKVLLRLAVAQSPANVSTAATPS